MDTKTFNNHLKKLEETFNERVKGDVDYLEHCKASKNLDPKDYKIDYKHTLEEYANKYGKKVKHGRSLFYKKDELWLMNKHDTYWKIDNESHFVYFVAKHSVKKPLIILTAFLLLGGVTAAIVAAVKNWPTSPSPITEERFKVVGESNTVDFSMDDPRGYLNGDIATVTLRPYAQYALPYVTKANDSTIGTEASGIVIEHGEYIANSYKPLSSSPSIQIKIIDNQDAVLKIEAANVGNRLYALNYDLDRCGVIQEQYTFAKDEYALVTIGANQGAMLPADATPSSYFKLEDVTTSNTTTSEVVDYTPNQDRTQAELVIKFGNSDAKLTCKGVDSDKFYSIKFEGDYCIASSDQDEYNEGDTATITIKTTTDKKAGQMYTLPATAFTGYTYFKNESTYPWAKTATAADVSPVAGSYKINETQTEVTMKVIVPDCNFTMVISVTPVTANFYDLTFTESNCKYWSSSYLYREGDQARVFVTPNSSYRLPNVYDDSKVIIDDDDSGAFYIEGSYNPNPSASYSLMLEFGHHNVDVEVKCIQKSLPEHYYNIAFENDKCSINAPMNIFSVASDADEELEVNFVSDDYCDFLSSTSEELGQYVSLISGTIKQGFSGYAYTQNTKKKATIKVKGSEIDSDLNIKVGAKIEYDVGPLPHYEVADVGEELADENEADLWIRANWAHVEDKKFYLKGHPYGIYNFYNTVDGHATPSECATAIKSTTNLSGCDSLLDANKDGDEFPPYTKEPVLMPDKYISQMKTQYTKSFLGTNATISDEHPHVTLSNIYQSKTDFMSEVIATFKEKTVDEGGDPAGTTYNFYVKDSILEIRKTYANTSGFKLKGVIQYEEGVPIYYKVAFIKETDNDKYQGFMEFDYHNDIIYV